MRAEQPIREWIDDVCRRYSRAMGVELAFHPAHDLEGPVGAGGAAESDEQWRARVSDGTRDVGVLRLRTRTRGDRRRDAQFLQACEAAELTAQLIERAVGEHARRRLLKAELQVASQTQPSSSVSFLGRGGWCELAGFTQSVRGIGGDLFELIPRSDDRLFIAVGDAAGHSIPAAMVMATVRGAIRTLVGGKSNDSENPSLPPHELLRRINTTLHGIVRAHQFMTLFCGDLDPRSMTFTYANAGHPPPLLSRRRGVERLRTHGLVLGVVDDTDYASEVVRLSPGDLLTFYTDGVTEAASSTRQLFGVQRLENTLLTRSGNTAIEIRDELWAALQKHVARSGQHDDRTLAILQIAGHPLP